jgi:2-dehydropantoate 2-reductase
MGGTTAVLPLLNGMKHLDRLEQKFGREQVLGGAAQIIATLNPAGEIVQMNEIHTLIFGERGAPMSQRCEELAAIMAKANFISKLSPDIRLEMWEKFVFLATLAGMTCLMRAGIGPIVRSDDGEALMLEMFEECRKVAAAEGSEPRAEMLQRARAMLTDRKQTFTASMMRDIEKGGPIEGDHIVGDMLVRARKHGIAAPLLRVATSHLQTYEIVRKQA